MAGEPLLSRRRRLSYLAITLAGALLVGLAGLTVIWPAGEDGERRPLPSQDVAGPVLLVPGYGGGTRGVERLAGRIRATGREATVVRLPGNATGDLRTQAAALDRFVAAALAAGAPSVDIVGQSAGGVVARLWVQEYDGAHKARRVVTLGSPHHGARLALAGAVFAPAACPTACQQLVPGSRFLAGLRTPVSTPPSWLALWTVQDQTVTPPASAALEGGLSLSVQSVCPRLRVVHSALPSNPVVTRMVLAAIEPGPLNPPTSALCTSGTADATVPAS